MFAATEIAERLTCEQIPQRCSAHRRLSKVEPMRVTVWQAGSPASGA